MKPKTDAQAISPGAPQEPGGYLRKPAALRGGERRWSELPSTRWRVPACSGSKRPGACPPKPRHRRDKPPHLPCRFLSLLFLLLAGSWPGPLTAKVANEYQIKAAFLYNFTKFVEWPPVRTADPRQPIIIGVLGRDPFDGELEKIIQGRQVGGRALAVRSVQSAAAAAAVDLLFVCHGEEARLEAMQETLQRAGVLTVGESERFLSAGGMIRLVVDGNKMRFAVSLAASERAGLKLSAQLLKLAIRVDRKPRDAS